MSDAPIPRPVTPAAHPVRDALAHTQDRLAAAFGIAPADREATIAAMLQSSGHAPAGYWLQLMLAMGIASLGLALSSTAVVIGAMLISPLMGPIVTLGMGLATGSPLLVMRSIARTAASVLVVVISAAGLMLALPFNEVTPEIAARTSPTALDLLVAVFCALAAAYTAVRPGSETTATAAGTAIGIALVPPLCVIGYGLGTGSRTIASGAALLFTANFCAILLFAVLSFLLLGYSAVGAAAMEQAELERPERGMIVRLARGLQFVFGLRYGAALRVLMPLLLVGAVFVPLREALARVTWQVRLRAAIQAMLAELPQETVRSSITIDGVVAVRLLTIGKAEDAARLQGELREKIAAVAGMVPKVEVIAVPDAAALEQIAALAQAPSPPVETVRREPDLVLLRQALGGGLSRVWPAAAGPLLAYRVELPEGAPAVVEVVHVGTGLGAPGAALLARDLSREVGAELAVRDVALPVEPIVAEPDAGLSWLPRVLAVAGRLELAPGLRLCVESPGTSKGKTSKDVESVRAVLRALEPLQGGRAVLRDGPRWKATVTAAPCFEDPSVSADGGAPDGGASDGGASDGGAPGGGAPGGGASDGGARDAMSR